VELDLKAHLRVDNAENIIVNITPSLPSSVEDLDNHNLDPHAHPPIQERLQQVEAEAFYFGMIL